MLLIVMVAGGVSYYPARDFIDQILSHSPLADIIILSTEATEVYHTTRLCL
jgi:hypothetical protein